MNLPIGRFYLSPERRGCLPLQEPHGMCGRGPSVSFKIIFQSLVLMSITRYLSTILDRTSSPRRGQLGRRKSRNQLQDPPPKTFFVCSLQPPTFDLTLFAFQRPSLYAHHYPSFGISSCIHAPMTIICSLQRLSVFSWYRHTTHEGVFSPHLRCSSSISLSGFLGGLL